MEDRKKEFWEKVEVFINKEMSHSFPHGFSCNDCKDDFKEIAKFIAHELRIYAHDNYNDFIINLEKCGSVDETLKKRIIEELRAREYEFETIVIRALEDWGVTTSKQ
jgi:hypothetical protein